LPKIHKNLCRAFILAVFLPIFLFFHKVNAQTGSSIKTIAASSIPENGNVFCPVGESVIIDDSRFFLYIPGNIDCKKRHPLVIIFSPSGEVLGPIQFFKPLADKYQWLILGSKKFYNGVNTDPIFKELTDALNDDVFVKYPVDRNKVIASGISGGGMAAHLIAFEYPQIIWAIIVNTGADHPYCRKYKDRYPRFKLAVFLASPADFNYSVMESDRKLLIENGWRVKWLEFEGGHTLAPFALYDQAAQWLTEQ